MIKAFVLSLLLAALAGCVIPPPSHGNFIENTTASNDQKMAADAVNQLLALFPPAGTTFNLQQVTPDVFGSTLVGSLRQKGYALLEFKPAPQPQEMPPAKGFSLGYILDKAMDSNIHRVTLQIGNQTLTRAYVMQAGSVHAAGSWVRKE